MAHNFANKPNFTFVFVGFVRINFTLNSLISFKSTRFKFEFVAVAIFSSNFFGKRRKNGKSKPKVPFLSFSFCQQQTVYCASLQLQKPFKRMDEYGRNVFGLTDATIFKMYQNKKQKNRENTK